MNPITASNGIRLTHLALGVQIMQGKITAVKVWVGNRAMGATNVFATDYLSDFPPATISDTGFTVHVHKGPPGAPADFVRFHDKTGTVAFTLNIPDVVYTPAP